MSRVPGRGLALRGARRLGLQLRGIAVSDYRRLSIAQKRTQHLARMRAPAVTCPSCDIQVMPSDLLAHVTQRCTGPREPGPGDKWLTWREAVALGVSEMNLSRWSRGGKVRSRGGRGDRQYLERDLQVWLARWKLKRRRD